MISSVSGLPLPSGIGALHRPQVLFLDKGTISIISSCFQQYEIYEKQIYLFERIYGPNYSKRNVIAYLKCICFFASYYF